MEPIEAACRDDVRDDVRKVVRSERMGRLEDAWELQDGVRTLWTRGARSMGLLACAWDGQGRRTAHGAGLGVHELVGMGEPEPEDEPSEPVEDGGMVHGRPA